MRRPRSLRCSNCKAVTSGEWLVTFKLPMHGACEFRLKPSHSSLATYERGSMKAIIESTSKVIELQIPTPSTKVRIWEGFTEHGVKFHAYIVRVVVAPDQDSSQFDKELTETRAPSAEVAAIPLRMIL
jgi:hypothetical protein